MATKSKSSSVKSRGPFYAVAPEWADITPIPLMEGPPGKTDSGPALATIAYSPRYSEAMSYLRAVMAKNEFSRRTLDLTEDIIAMNPAHYTVWLYRAKILQSLWAEPDGVGQEEGVKQELEWLEGVSERNLKNYQIWHHRQLLLSQLPVLPEKEIPFLTHILSFDAKNYHAWTYRQWLCRRFPEPLLSSTVELDALDALIADDVRNNSAWSHRYFVCFGVDELAAIEAQGGNRKQVLASGQLVVNEEVVDIEINYAKDQIARAPQNPSPWNYLKGVMRYAGRPLGDMQVFCEGFVGGKNADLMGEQVRSSHAVDWLAEIYKESGDLEKSKRCLEALGQKWDPIRRKYWEYRAGQVQEPAVQGSEEQRA